MMGSSGYQGGPRSLLESFGGKEVGRVRGGVLLRLMRFVLPFWPVDRPTAALCQGTERRPATAIRQHDRDAMDAKKKLAW